MSPSCWAMDVPVVETDWWDVCPACGHEAACQLRRGKPYYAILWCRECRHLERLKRPESEIDMATATTNFPAVDPWSMDVTTASGGDYELCPPGNYPGFICALVDVGHHDANDKDGRPYQRRLLVLGFELAKKKKNGEPFILAERYTWSMSNNANFYTLATNLTGAKKEGEKFDPRVLVGLAVMVQVTNQTTTKNGKDRTYHNVGSVAQFPEGLPLPTPGRTPIAWSVLEGTPPPDTSWLPYVYGDSVAKMIETSHEFKAGRVPASEAAAAAMSAGADPVPF